MESGFQGALAVWLHGAKKAGVSAAIYFDEHGRTEAVSLLGSMKGASTHSMDTTAALTGDPAVMQGLREWLHQQRDSARHSSTHRTNG